MSEETRTSILESSQSFLSGNPGFPQFNFQGKHEIDVQLPKRELTQSELDDFVKVVFSQSEVQDILETVIKLAVGKIQTEIKNQGNAAATRAPQVSSTTGKSWKAAIADKNVELATRMLERFTEDADLFGYSVIQLDALGHELGKIRDNE